MQRVTVHVYGQAVCWQELSSPIEAKGKMKIIFLDRWRISLFQRKSFSKPTAIRMPTTLCLAPELSGKLSTVLRFNHYISLQSFASCVCHYWLYLVWKTFSCTWQFLEGIAAFACFWRPVCFKHWEDDNFGSQNKCMNPLFFSFSSVMTTGASWLTQLEGSCSSSWLHTLHQAVQSPKAELGSAATVAKATSLPPGTSLETKPEWVKFVGCFKSLATLGFNHSIEFRMD